MENAFKQFKVERYPVAKEAFELSHLYQDAGQGKRERVWYFFFYSQFELRHAYGEFSRWLSRSHEKAAKVAVEENVSSIASH